MPLIDLHCHLGTTLETLALKAPEATAARTYADQFGVEFLCFSAPRAAVDLIHGNEELMEHLALDRRFQGWLTLSVHQPELSMDLARRFLVKAAWFGTLIEQSTDADSVMLQGGREVLNALRRYSRPVLLTYSSPATLHAALDAAREFNTLKFLLSPQTEYMTAITVPAMKEVINTVFLPVAAYAERDVVAHAVHVLGERRIAWASDWGRFHPAAALGMIRDSALSGPQRERVGYRNARDLIA
jgi:predicted TIM-barrel fold metal-dependent hydrolase